MLSIKRYILAGMLLLGWAVASALDPAGLSLFPNIGQVTLAWWNLLQDGSLAYAAAASLGRVTIGFALAACLAVGCAIIASMNTLVRDNLVPLVEILRYISPIAWTPFAILWFTNAGIFIVFIAAVFPIFSYALHGLSTVPRPAILAARSLGASQVSLLQHVVIPATLPSLLTGLRIGLGFAWMSVIAAELFAVQSGLGYLIEVNRLSARMDAVVALMFTIGLIGLALSASLAWVERHLAPWHRSYYAEDN